MKSFILCFYSTQNMLPLLLIFIIPHVSTKTDGLSNETLHEIELLNDLKYSHESKIIGHNATFTFKIYNTTYARDILGITLYYISITFIDEERHEERTNLTDLSTEEIEYHGDLIMAHLDEEGNYLICVFFLNDSLDLIGSSRFCHVISVAETCELKVADNTISNRHIYVLLIFVVVILLTAVIFSVIRDYVYRPRTIDALLKTLPTHHAHNLENLAGDADTRRRRRTQPTLNNRLREDSVLAVEYDPNADHDYHNYHGHDNLSLDTLTE
jgi:hypothetical protein